MRKEKWEKWQMRKWEVGEMRNGRNEKWEVGEMRNGRNEKCEMRSERNEKWEKEKWEVREWEVGEMRKRKWEVGEMRNEEWEKWSTKLPIYSNNSEFQTQRERTWPLNVVNVATRFFAAIPQSNINQKHKKNAQPNKLTRHQRSERSAPPTGWRRLIYTSENLGMGSCRN